MIIWENEKYFAEHDYDQVNIVKKKGKSIVAVIRGSVVMEQVKKLIKERKDKDETQ